MGQSVFQYNRKVSHRESKSAPYSLKKTHRLTQMHALFKWDERVSWQRGLLNIAMGYDTSVTGDSENSDLLTRWALPKGNRRDDDLGSISTTSEPPDHSKGCFYSWCFCLCLFFRGGISRMRREMSCRRGTPRTRVGRRHLGMWRSCRTQVQGPQRPRVQVTGKQRQLGRGPQHVTCVSPSLLSKGPPWWPMQHKDGV